MLKQWCAVGSMEAESWLLNGMKRFFSAVVAGVGNLNDYFYLKSEMI